jgi:hypothetical protein
LSAGCSFVCTTDHAEYFDEKSLGRYISECESLSDENFRFVAGLEYRCDRDMHILGFGATIPTPTTEPQEVIRHINSQGAVSVIAHPKDDSFAWIESFHTRPKGIETWNTKYDGQHAPRTGTFALLQRLRQDTPTIHAFYGQDLHWKKQFRGMFLILDCNSLDRATILAALHEGNYKAQKEGLQLASSGVLPLALLAAFGRVQARSQRIRQLLKKGKNTLDRVGIKVPAALKAQLRRMF